MTVIIDGTAGITFPNSTTQAVAGAPLTTPSFTTTIGVGAATASARGAGVTFPATQSASSDANTLDDYEEGTFTPQVIGSSTEGTATYSTQYGKYTKIGDRVQISLFINYTGGTGTGSMNIKGLPFTADSTNQPLANYNANIAMTGGHVMQLITGSSSTLINVNSVPSGGGADANVAYDSTGLIMAGGNYKIL